MKKFLVLVLALVLALSSFAACAKDDETNSSADSSAASVEESKAPVSVSLSAADIIPMMAAEETFESSADSVFNDTGIKNDTYENFFWVVELSGLSAETIGFFKANSEKDAADIKTLLEGYLTSVTNQYKDYNADNYAMAQKAVIKTEGVYVYFVMSPNVTNIVNAINSAFNG